MRAHQIFFASLVLILFAGGLIQFAGIVALPVTMFVVAALLIFYAGCKAAGSF